MSQPSPSVAIAGGGLAGLSAACALSDAGFRVTLFKKRPFLGGRASSYEHPGTGEVVDNCQHVLLRVCTNLVEFYERIGVANQIRWFDQMNFIEPGGRTSIMNSSFLPAPLHTAPSFWNFSFLSTADKFSISRALMPLTLREQRDTGESFQKWLDQHHQSPTAGRLVDRGPQEPGVLRRKEAAHAGIGRSPWTTPALHTWPRDSYPTAGSWIRPFTGKIIRAGLSP